MGIFDNFIGDLLGSGLSSVEMLEKARNDRKKADEKRKADERKIYNDALEQSRLEEAKLEQKRLKEIETEGNKIGCCSECNRNFKKRDLNNYVQISYFNLDEWERYGICSECEKKISDRFMQIEKESTIIKTYPATYKGNKHIDRNSIKKDIQSGYYRQREFALTELKIRAYLEGYDIVFDWYGDFETQSEPSNNGSGTYLYKVFSVTGSFAKKTAQQHKSKESVK